MPNFDKTGPAGQGAATGMRGGSCAKNQQANPIGSGRGYCGNRGRGFQNGNECVSLDDQEKMLEKRLEEVRVAKRDLNSDKNA